MYQSFIKNNFQRFFSKLLLIDERLISDRRTFNLFVLLVSTFSLFIVSYYGYLNVVTATYPFDIDGIGHVIGKMSSLGECKLDLDFVYNSDRGFVLPFIFGLSYCILGTDVSVQVLNCLLHASSVAIIMLFSKKFFNTALLPAFASLLWSVWPAYSFLHGFYFPEQVSAFFIMLSVYFSLKISAERHSSSLVTIFLFSIVLAMLFNIRASSLLLVLVFLLLALYNLRLSLIKSVFALIISVSCLSILPIVNYNKLDKFVLTTTQGGFALHLGTFVPGNSSPASLQREIPEFISREDAAQNLNSYEKDKYFKSLAMQNIKEDPIGQIRLLVRKTLKFWFNLNGFLPTTKSLVFGLPIFLCWITALYVSRSKKLMILNIAVLTNWAMHSLVYSEYRYSYVVFALIILTPLVVFRDMLSKLFSPSHNV